MTERYYLENPYLTELNAHIIHRFKRDNLYFIELDKTIAYPNLSGGQPTEGGLLENLPLENTIEEDNKIYHVLKTDLSKPKVLLKINWKKRFDYMQQHSGQHVLSYCINKLYNFNTIGFNLSDTKATIDINTTNFSADHINKTELLCQNIINSNIPIKTYTINKKKAQHLKIPKKLENLNDIRIVEIEDLDYNPCSGTHVSNTSEINIIKIIKKEKINGKTRLHFLCGNRAFLQFQEQTKLLDKLFDITSSNISTLEKTLENSQNKYEKLVEKINNYESNEIANETSLLKQSSKSYNNIFLTSKIYENYSLDLIKQISNNLIKDEPYIAVIGLKNESNCNIILSKNKKIEVVHMNEILMEIKDLVGGKGGGSEYFAQIGGNQFENLESAIKLATEKIEICLE